MARAISACFLALAAATGLAWALACSSGQGDLEPVPRSDAGGYGCLGSQTECGEVCCAAPYVCVDGGCACPSHFLVCEEECVDPASDPRHCGECSSGCAPGQSCVTGTCTGGDGCADACPVPGGITWGCNTRFMYGVNYAWYSFGADFGGIAAWGTPGVASNAEIEADLAEISGFGANVVRWWVFPALRGEGVLFDDSDTPTGLGGTALVDLRRALELADRYQLYLMLCLFSFDNFQPTGDSSGLWVRGLYPIATDAAKRSALVQNVIRPFARAAEASPYRDHLIAWDVVNEPEGAMHGLSKYGDPSFPAWADLETLTHDEMETFIADVIAGLRQESGALVTVGGLETMYRRAWSQVDIDFYQFHNYGSWPYTRSPSDLGITDKPVIIGEFPWDGIGGDSYAQVLASLYADGYAGALTWQYNEHRGGLEGIAAFANQHPCETHY